MNVDKEATKVGVNGNATQGALGADRFEKFLFRHVFEKGFGPSHTDPSKNP